MPFDGNPKQFVKPDVFSLEGLAAWLETQDGATEYSYSNCGDCLLHRYLRNNGIQLPVNFGIGGDEFVTSDLKSHALPRHFNDVSLVRPHTYAAALDRCRALIAEGK